MAFHHVESANERQFCLCCVNCPSYLCRRKDHLAPSTFVEIPYSLGEKITSIIIENKIKLTVHEWTYPLSHKVKKLNQLKNGKLNTT